MNIAGLTLDVLFGIVGLVLFLGAIFTEYLSFGSGLLGFIFIILAIILFVGMNNG